MKNLENNEELATVRVFRFQFVAKGKMPYSSGFFLSRDHLINNDKVAPRDNLKFIRGQREPPEVKRTRPRENNVVLQLTFFLG